MKIAIATKDFTEVSGHAGQARQWLLYDLSDHQSNKLLPAPRRIDLNKDQVLHVFEDNEPHPLDGVDIVVAASASVTAVSNAARVSRPVSGLTWLASSRRSRSRRAAPTSWWIET